MAIATIDDLRAELSFTPDMGTLDDAMLIRKGAAAQGFIERQLGFKIEARFGGADQEPVPQELVEAVCKLAAHWYEAREAAGDIEASGRPVETWTDLATLRAEKLDQTTEEFIRGSGANDETVIIFRSRFIAGVTNADRILFGGQPFNIKEVMPLGRNRGLEFRCMRIET